MLMLVNLFPLVNSKKLQSVENMWTSLFFFVFFSLSSSDVHSSVGFFIICWKKIKIPFFPSIKHPLQNRSQTTRSTYIHTHTQKLNERKLFDFSVFINIIFFLCFIRCHSSIEWRRKKKNKHKSWGNSFCFVRRKGKKTKDSKISGTITLQFHLPTQLSNRGYWQCTQINWFLYVLSNSFFNTFTFNRCIRNIWFLNKGNGIFFQIKCCPLSHF